MLIDECHSQFTGENRRNIAVSRKWRNGRGKEEEVAEGYECI